MRPRRISISHIVGVYEHRAVHRYIYVYYCSSSENNFFQSTIKRKKIYIRTYEIALHYIYAQACDVYHFARKEFALFIVAAASRGFSLLFYRFIFRKYLTHGKFAAVSFDEKFKTSLEPIVFNAPRVYYKRI